ncbi:recombinase family protein [Streptomyces sp. SPB78]|uniref:recombinase family protein n=1 Tax=Streptomyces sp. (strain SPB78) TaxID=591157 RepID=UPI00055C879B|nr:recombinase family protein [Streptomyces sp. SPB78]
MTTASTRNPLAGTVYTETLRGVRCVRLSVLTDETTSPERQREADDRAAAELGISFGEGDNLREAVDLDVSASKTSPFDRPELGAWLARPQDFDALVWWRFDRAIRNMADMHELAKWARTHRKLIVFAEGLGGSGRLEFDFRNPVNPVSELMMTFFAFAAQVESQSISDRVTGAMAALRKMTLRWRGGGKPPYGYMPAEMPAEHGGKGWTLVPDPDAVKVIERIVKELLGGVTASMIAAGLNADGIPSPRDHWALKMKRKTGGKTGGARGEKGVTRERWSWNPAVITRMLRNPSLLGWKMHNGKPVRDDKGNPIMSTAEPIMTREEFDRIGAVLDERSINNSVRNDTDALLLRVVHCAHCGHRMYKSQQEGRNPFYKCNSHARGELCEQPANVRADWTDDYVSAEFLRLVGSVQTTHVVTIPGYDPEPELRATVAEYAEHQEQKGRQKSKHAAAEWQRRADALDARIADLETREARPEQRTVTPTGRTIADEWAATDTAGRRALLIEAGARLEVTRGTRGGWRKLDVRRVSFTVNGAFDPAAETVTTAAEDVASVERGDHPAPGSVARLTEPEPVRELVAA